MNSKQVSIINLSLWSKLKFALISILLLSCNGDNTPDCFQNAGDLVRNEVAVANFDKITVFERVRLVLRQDAVQRVEIETGEFLKDEVSATVKNGTLILRNANSCNLFREYGLTTVFVSSPNITEIRSSTGLPIESDGVLGFPSLQLISESFINTDTETTDGSFDLELASETVGILVNGIAFFKLSGSTENLSVTIAAGDSRVEAEQLTAQNVNVNHRGSNNIRINPQESLVGVIRGTGDVLSFNRPETIDVEVLFRGKLIFKD